MVRALQDHRWTLQSATDSAGQPIDTLLPPGHPYVMSFDGARLSIKGGCNQLVGGWRLAEQWRAPFAMNFASQTARHIFKTLMALAVGASLSVSGVIFQAVLKNPLADPYITGVSGGTVTTSGVIRSRASRRPSSP